MPSYKHHGKNIKLIERISGKLISELALEATGFSSLHEYAVSFCKYYRCPGRMIRGVKNAIMQYAVEAYGKEWCKKNYNVGRGYLKVAGRYFGVAPEDVINHMVTHDIDLATFVRINFKKDDYTRVYSFFFTRTLRAKGGSDASV